MFIALVGLTTLGTLGNFDWLVYYVGCFNLFNHLFKSIEGVFCVSSLGMYSTSILPPLSYPFRSLSVHTDLVM